MSLLHPVLTHDEIDALYAAHAKAVHDAALATAKAATWEPLAGGGRKKRTMRGAE